MTARWDAFGCQTASVNHRAVDLAKGDPELDEDGHKFQDVDMLFVLVQSGFQVIVSIVPADIGRETTALEVRRGKAPHVVQMV
jgi:hypothetical protein